MTVQWSFYDKNKEYTYAGVSRIQCATNTMVNLIEANTTVKDLVGNMYALFMIP